MCVHAEGRKDWYFRVIFNFGAAMVPWCLDVFLCKQFSRRHIREQQPFFQHINQPNQTKLNEPFLSNLATYLCVFLAKSAKDVPVADHNWSFWGSTRRAQWRLARSKTRLQVGVGNFAPTDCVRSRAGDFFFGIWTYAVAKEMHWTRTLGMGLHGTLVH